MAQDRMIRASMRESEKVNGWPIELRFFWTQLWGFCDDFGRGRLDNRLLKAGTFPLDDDVTPERIGRWMQALEMAGVVRTYSVSGKRYFECVNWHEHQELPYFRRTDVPESCGCLPTSGKRSEVLQKILEHSCRIEGNRKEREGEGKAPDGALSPFCFKHPLGTESSCKACGNARRAYDAAVLRAKSKPTVSGIVTDPDCSTHPGRPARGCDRCVEEGVA